MVYILINKNVFYAHNDKHKTSITQEIKMSVMRATYVGSM